MTDARIRLTIGPTTYRLLKARAQLLELTVPNLIRFLIYGELGQANAWPKSISAKKVEGNDPFDF